MEFNFCARCHLFLPVFMLGIITIIILYCSHTLYSEYSEKKKQEVQKMTQIRGEVKVETQGGLAAHSVTPLQ